MKILDLFAGLGGFSLAAHWLGWETAAFVEKEPFCQKLLAKNFKGVPIYGDITTFSAKSFRGAADIITAGFPCPAFSAAGKRGGFEQDGLFYEIWRIASECEPRWIVLENVENIANSKQSWLADIRKTIEANGYEFTDAVLDGRDFGVPQMRRRYFAVCVHRGILSCSQPLSRFQRKPMANFQSVFTDVADTERRWAFTVRSDEEWRVIGTNARRSRDHHGIPDRLHRLKALGNSINPQIAYEIFKAIQEAESDE